MCKPIGFRHDLTQLGRAAAIVGCHFFELCIDVIVVGLQLLGRGQGAQRQIQAHAALGIVSQFPNERRWLLAGRLQPLLDRHVSLLQPAAQL